MTVAKTVLDNGVTLVSEEVPHLPSATAGIWVAVGSRAESPSDNGIGHFIEHMLFKGTARRSAQDISREIESVGGTMNAYTERECIFFFARALAKDFALVADLLSDIYGHSRFDARELEREKGVVLQEILMAEDSPEDLLYDFFHETYWGGHPLGLPIQGTSAGVAAFTRDRVTNYFYDRFLRRGVVVSVVGSVPHRRVVAEFGKRLERLALGERLAPDPAPAPRHGVFRKERPIEQIHLCLGAPAPSRTSEWRYVTQVLNAILGGGMSSRLFQEIREKRGLAYSVFSSAAAYADAGLLTVCAATTPAKAGEVLAAAGEILSDLAAGRFREEEVALARELIKGTMLLALESGEFRMSRLAVNEMFLARLDEPEDEIREIDAVSTDRVRDLAARLLRRERFSLAAVGGVADAGAVSF